MARPTKELLGTGGARNAAEALEARKKKNEAALADSGATRGTPTAQARTQPRGPSASSYRDHQMAQAIEMVRKRKSSSRSDY